MVKLGVAKFLIKQQPRYPILDVLRVFLALWVATFHLSGGHGWFSHLKHPYGNVLAQGKFGFFSSFFRLGFVAVPIFFVISGFVIARSSKNKSALEFFASRFSRLMPAYAFSIVITILVSSFGFSTPFNLTVTNIVSSLNLSWVSENVSSLQGSYWTLWPEIRFYGLFLIFVILTARFGLYTKRVFFLFVGLLIFQYFHESNQTVISQLSLSDYGIFFIVGGFLAIIKTRGDLKILAVFLISSLCFAVLNLRSWVFQWDPTHARDWRLATLLFLIGVVMVGFSSRFVIKNDRVSKNINLLGRSTYVFYLLQEGLGMPVASFCVNHGIQIRFALLLALFLCSIVSVLFTIFFEARVALRLRSVLIHSMSSLS